MTTVYVKAKGARQLSVKGQDWCIMLVCQKDNHNKFYEFRGSGVGDRVKVRYGAIGTSFYSGGSSNSLTWEKAMETLEKKLYPSGNKASYNYHPDSLRWEEYKEKYLTPKATSPFDRITTIDLILGDGGHQWWCLDQDGNQITQTTYNGAEQLLKRRPEIYTTLAVKEALLKYRRAAV